MSDLTTTRGGQSATVPTREMAALINRLASIMDGEASYEDAAHHLELVIDDAVETMSNMNRASWDESPITAKKDSDRVIQNLVAVRAILTHYPSLAARAHQMHLLVEMARTYLYLMGVFSSMEPKARTRGDIITYLVRHPGTGLIKIGRTRDIRTRLSALECGAGQALTVLGVIDGDVERALHRRFANLREHGEWFSDPDGVISGHALSAGYLPEDLQARVPPACEVAV